VCVCVCVCVCVFFFLLLIFIDIVLCYCLYFVMFVVGLLTYNRLTDSIENEWLAEIAPLLKKSLMIQIAISSHLY